MAPNEIPKLPEHVSNDGREIWDWAGKMGELAERNHQIRTLRQQIANLQDQCGSCEYWMTDSCPMEKHNNRTGRKEGPSMASAKCGKFSMSKSDAEMVETAKVKLAALEVRE